MGRVVALALRSAAIDCSVDLAAPLEDVRLPLDDVTSGSAISMNRTRFELHELGLCCLREASLDYQSVTPTSNGGLAGDAVLQLRFVATRAGRHDGEGIPTRCEHDDPLR